MTALRRLLPWTTIVFFGLLVVLSLSAGLAGIDPDMRWGLLRKAVLFVGAAGLLGTASLQLIRTIDRRLISKRDVLEGTGKWGEIGPRSSQTKPISPDPLISSPADPDRHWLSGTMVALTMVIVGTTYVGLISVWHWTKWPGTDEYYGMLANAFTHGKTYLPIEPAPGLSNSQDPFAGWGENGGIVNLSYYQGRYYIYWGPAPGVVLAALELVGAPALRDNAVVFGAISLTFVFSALTLSHLKRTYFKRLPTWLMIAGLVIVGTTHPMLWFQSSPGILTAAIASGQAFLVGGVYFMARALTEPRPRSWNYAAAGLFWGAAATSRLTTMVAIGALVLGIAVVVVKRAWPKRPKTADLVNLSLLVGPLGLMLGLYGWYNLIRFNNPFETGLRHQFVELNPNDQLARGTFFNLGYLVPNALHYFSTPPRLRSSFPYLRAVYYEYPQFVGILARLKVPTDYTVEDATGLLLAAPTLLFALVFARKWLYGEIPRHERGNAPQTGTGARTMVDQGTLGAILLLSGIAGGLPVLLFYYSTTRYEMDFVPLLAIVAVMGTWRLYSDTRRLPVQSRIVTALIILIVIWSTLASLLLAVSGAGSSFDDLNPELFSFLVSFLPHW